MSRRWRKLLATFLAAALAATPGGEALAAKPTKPGQTAPRVIAYVASGKLCTMDESGNNTYTVASDRNTDYYGVRWSPDGSRLYGYEKRSGDGVGDVALMSINSDGRDERIIVTYDEVDALNMANGKASIYDNDVGRATFSGASCGPDGRFIVFGATVVFPEHSIYVSGKTTCLYLVDLWGVEPLRQLTDNPTFFYGDWAPHWSPTHDKIVFSSDRYDWAAGSHVGLWVVNPNATGLTSMTIAGADPSDRYFRPMWSHHVNPDTGNPWLVVQTLNQDVMIFEVALQHDPPVATRVMTIADIEMESPVWSPNDSRLLYARNLRFEGDYGEIAILDLATQQETVLLHSTKKRMSGGWFETPDWKPEPQLP